MIAKYLRILKSVLSFAFAGLAGAWHEPLLKRHEGAVSILSTCVVALTFILDSAARVRVFPA